MFTSFNDHDFAGPYRFICAQSQPSISATSRVHTPPEQPWERLPKYFTTKTGKVKFFGIFTVGAEGRLYFPVSALQQNFFGRSRKPQHAFRKYSGIHQASDIYPSGSVWFCPACQNFGKYKVVFENFSYANKGLQASASLSFFACASAKSVPFVVK